MKANELRIGNWLRDNQVDFKVKALEEDMEFTDIAIPLTIEWLEKSGFEETNDDGLWTHSKSSEFQIEAQYLTNGFAHIWDAAYTDAPVMFVHQLQNLYFAMTGEELAFTNTIKP